MKTLSVDPAEESWTKLFTHISRQQYTPGTGLAKIDTNCLRLTPNGTNLAFFNISFQYIWDSLSQNVLKSDLHMSQVFPIWCQSDPNLGQLLTLLAWTHMTHCINRTSFKQYLQSNSIHYSQLVFHFAVYTVSYKPYQ